MINDVEELLVTAMREEVAGLQAPAGIVARAAGRRNRWLTPGAAVTATGVAAAFVIGVTGTLLTVVPHRPGVERSAAPIVIESGSPVATADPSYRVQVLDTSFYPKRATPLKMRWDYTGVYDPEAQKGEGRRTFVEDGKPQVHAVRLIADSFYEQETSRVWIKRLGSFPDILRPHGGRPWGSWNGRSADFGALLATLKARGAVQLVGRTGSGPAAVDRYAFSYVIAGDVKVSEHRMTGTVEVHHESNLIAEIRQQTTVVFANTETTDADSLVFATTISFSDYGTPVEVTMPSPVTTG